jgi:HK97 family phage major capsid protein
MAITTSANSTLSQDIVERILVQPLAQRSSFLSLGVPEFISDGNPVHLPSLTAIGTATGFVAEGAEIGEASVATSEIVLLQSSVYAVKDIVKLTTEAVETAAINLETAMSSALVGRVAQLVDNALFNGGTATTGSPIGVFNMTGFTNAGTVAGTALAPSDLYGMQEDYSLAYGDESTAIWMVHPSNMTRVRLMEDTAGQRVLQPSLAQGVPNQILGVPYVVTTHAPATSIVLADRNQLAVGRAPASVTILDQTFADYGQIGIRVSARYDVKALNAAAIVKLTIT